MRDPQHPDRLDASAYTGEGLGEPAPVRVSAAEGEQAQAFTLGEAPALEGVQDLMAIALE
ncbi:hypothetical protein [Streptomonospora arabica]|uniref:Uncharacterized protein n=1 Tax=Streptomonospora arabica TaxID=412417 RepID=A0ABV9SJR1_9ACTN